jgi:hypothetical protein
MTAFDPLKFNLFGEWLTYEGRFVARFKYRPRSAPSFRSFLAVNFTVEEYFGRLDAGELPIRILESKGYVQPHVKRLLRESGLPPTPAGKQEYLRMQELKRTSVTPTATLFDHPSAGRSG